MPNKKINQLDVRTGVSLTDLSLVGDPASGTSFKLTLNDVSTVMGVPGKFNQPTGTAAQYIRGDGQLATFPSSAGGGSSVNYYLNGSVNASVAGYKQLDNAAIVGGGTDFTLVGNGLIAQFLTNVGNPNRIQIPGGAWNFEMFFQVSSSGGNQKFYVELHKYDGSTFTLIASSSTVPEEITGGTSIDLYLTSLAVPTTALLATDRLAIRVYIVDNSGGRTVTLHTENNTLCEIITTFSGGVASLNGLTANTQYLATGTSGTDFNINSLVDTHTFNLPTASATNRGALSTADWSTFNSKIGGTGVSGQVAYWSGASTQTGDNGLTWDSVNKRLSINTSGQGRTITTFYGAGSVGQNIFIGGGGLNSGIGGGPANFGSYNTSLGVNALLNNTTGEQNSAFGVSALSANTTGYQNVANGYLSLNANTNGAINTSIGVLALLSNTSGNNNTSLGYSAGYGVGANANTTGSNNIFIGSQSVGVSATESNRTWIGNSTTTSTWLAGNLLLGSTTNGTQRLQVTGDTLLKGSGNTSATTALTVQDSGGANMLRLLSDTTLKLGSQNIDIFPTANGSTVANAGRGLIISTGAGSQGTGAVKIVGTSLDAAGNNWSLWLSHTFGASSGTATHSGLLLNQTINQTGGASGITRGLYVNPTLTAAADWRSIETSNNNGWAFYGAGTAQSQFGGAVTIAGGLTLSSGSLSLPVAIHSIFASAYRIWNRASNRWTFEALNANIGFEFKHIMTSGNAFNIVNTSDTSQFLVSGAGNTILGSTSDSTERLQVNGTMKVTGASTFGGNMTLSLNQDARSKIEISNTTSGASSVAIFVARSSGAGVFEFSKSSATTTAYKILSPNDGNLYNFSGDIAILNDNTTGSIKMAAGGSSTAHLTIKSNGRINMSSLPTSATGLSAGDLWNDAGTLKIV